MGVSLLCDLERAPLIGLSTLSTGPLLTWAEGALCSSDLWTICSPLDTKADGCWTPEGPAASKEEGADCVLSLDDGVFLFLFLPLVDVDGELLELLGSGLELVELVEIDLVTTGDLTVGGCSDGTVAGDSDSF